MVMLFSAIITMTQPLVLYFWKYTESVLQQDVYVGGYIFIRFLILVLVSIISYKQVDKNLSLKE